MTLMTVKGENEINSITSQFRYILMGETKGSIGIGRYSEMEREIEMRFQRQKRENILHESLDTYEIIADHSHRQQKG